MAAAGRCYSAGRIEKYLRRTSLKHRYLLLALIVDIYVWPAADILLPSQHQRCQLDNFEQKLSNVAFSPMFCPLLFKVILHNWSYENNTLQLRISVLFEAFEAFWALIFVDLKKTASAVSYNASVNRGGPFSGGALKLQILLTIIDDISPAKSWQCWRRITKDWNGLPKIYQST